MKIVVAEKTSPAALAVLRQEQSWIVVTPDQIPAGELASVLADADALIVRSAVKVTAELLEHAPKLRVVGRAGIGVDNVDLEAATRKGVAVMNTPGANAVAVAELTLGMMLTMARHIYRANQTTRAGKWEKKTLEGSELRGKTLGIVGLGKIGMEVAKRASAFGMKIVGHDPFIAADIARDAGVELKPLDDVLGMSDYITLHLALTPQTNGFINTSTLSKMKKGVRIVNCARGELVNEADLATAIQSGHVAGAALDVFAAEPPKDLSLFALDQVLATPHIAGSTHEAQEAVGVQIAQQVKEYLSRGVIQNAVNVPSVSYEEYVDMHPFIILGERLGSFLAQAIGDEGGVTEIAVSYTGRIATWKTQLVRNAVTKGVLTSMIEEGANLVNAGTIANSRGIRVREGTKEPEGGFGDTVQVQLKTSKREHSIVGSAPSGRSPRILRLDGIDIEIPLTHDLIFMRNKDVPGVIGRIGTILGQYQINIANFSLGRAEQQKKAAEAAAGSTSETAQQAISVIQVDTRASENVLDELRKIPAITHARAIQLV